MPRCTALRSIAFFVFAMLGIALLQQQGYPLLPAAVELLSAAQS